MLEMKNNNKAPEIIKAFVLMDCSDCDPNIAAQLYKIAASINDYRNCYRYDRWYNLGCLYDDDFCNAWIWEFLIERDALFEYCDDHNIIDFLRSGVDIITAEDYETVEDAEKDEWGSRHWSAIYNGHACLYYWKEWGYEN